MLYYSSKMMWTREIYLDISNLFVTVSDALPVFQSMLSGEYPLVLCRKISVEIKKNVHALKLLVEISV